MTDMKLYSRYIKRFVRVSYHFLNVVASRLGVPSVKPNDYKKVDSQKYRSATNY